MANTEIPLATVALEVPPRAKPSVYPEPFASRMAGREKRQLGDFFGLSTFGVNLTRLLPGGVSALRHAHARQDEPKKLSWLRAIGLKLRQATGIIAIVGVTLWVS